MKISDNIYVNIDVNGMDITNFLNFSDVMDLRLMETAGASLPYFYMSFITTDETVCNSVQLGNQLKVIIGNTEKDADTFEIDMIPTQPVKDPSNTGWLVELAGFIGNKSYMIDQISKSYLGNSFLVADKAIKEYLSPNSKGNYVKTNFNHTNENQVWWRRNNKTACYFVADTLLHADVSPSFPVFSFDKYKNFYISDLSKLIKEGPVYTFSEVESTETNVIQYSSNFNVESFQEEYNLYSGYNKITEIYDTNSGLSKSIVDINAPILSSSAIAEESYSGNIVQMNEIQSTNVHKTYSSAFTYNTNKLMALSSNLGCIALLGRYYKELRPIMLVKVNSDEPSQDGLYLIDSIITKVNFTTGGFETYVYLTRDGKNHVEDYKFPRNQPVFKILKKRRNDLLSICTSIKTIYSIGMRFFDGLFLNDLLNFAVGVKYNLLHSFNFNGYTFNFNDPKDKLSTLIGFGNSIMNSFLKMILPPEIAYQFQDFIINKPSLKNVVLGYIGQYVDQDVIDVANLIASLVYDGTMEMYEIARDNLITIAIAGGAGVAQIIEDIIPEETYEQERQPEVNNILDSFEDNTPGLDIPYPNIPLTESESLLPEEDLRNLIADKTISNLEDLGYLDNVDKDKLKDILLGKETIDFDIINKINKSAGDTFSYRLWGTYNDITELNSFTIKKGFKDKYRTIPCTKLISALRNTKIFFACPTTEESLKFYINSKRAELKSFVVDLGYTDIYKNKILYNVYYTETGYNSNSILFEVKQRGIV